MGSSSTTAGREPPASFAPEGHAGAVEFASSKDTAAELELYREFFGYEL